MKETLKITINDSTTTEAQSIEDAIATLRQTHSEITKIKMESTLTQGASPHLKFDYAELAGMVSKCDNLRSLDIKVDASQCTLLRFDSVGKLNSAVARSESITEINYPCMSQQAKIKAAQNKLRLDSKKDALQCLQSLITHNNNISSLEDAELYILSTHLNDINNFLNIYSKTKISSESVENEIEARNNSTPSYFALMGIAALGMAAIKMPSLIMNYASQMHEFHIEIEI